MTARAKLLALCCLVFLCVGIRARNPLLAYFGLTILLWMFVSFVWFRWSANRVLRSIQVVRRVQGRDQTRCYLWAGRHYITELEITSKGWFQTSWSIRDIVPDILTVASTSGEQPASEPKPVATRMQKWMERFALSLANHESEKKSSESFAFRFPSPSKSVRHSYTIQPRAAGIAVLPGVRLEFFDSMGWYRLDQVVRCGQTLQILPGYRGRGELRQLLKPNNAIPQHGMHRQRRPGMGFELLELREYMDGDPPKTIAWKASARRETLMTRQYESEVPIRVQLFVEGTVACRIGSFGRRVIDQMNMLATSVAKITTRGGDWVGAYLIDGNGLKRVQPGTGEAGFHRIAQALSEFSCSEFPNRFRWTAAMQDATYALVAEYYPDQLKTSINPMGYSWWSMLHSKLRRDRVQLSCVLAERYGLTDYEHVQLMADDDSMAQAMQRFLSEHGRAWTSPMIPAYDIPKFLSQRAVDLLVKSIQQAIMRAKDNEVFIVVVDLLSSTRSLDDIVSVLRTAKSRHHRVVVISQSPDFEKPVTPRLIQGNEPDGPPRTASELRQLAEQIRLNERLVGAKRQFQELGIPFSVTSDESAIPTVLAEVDLARTGRTGTRQGTTIR
jgi:uncharacterized protein (DUF58 family)